MKKTTEITNRELACLMLGIWAVGLVTGIMVTMLSLASA